MDRRAGVSNRRLSSLADRLDVWAVLFDDHCARQLYGAGDREFGHRRRFVAPVLVLVSLLFPEKMLLVFSLPELVAMAASVLLMIVLSNDGDTNWFEGATLLAAYIIMGIGFYLL